ncbi:M15 family metallopeptidase [Nocardioides sp. YIM 152315]|uniref:M15 family metallopeptidase n=1 Tax=Nocardioides sp. YIM 152315 TaxID=3031760 RepID=UPI0023DAC4B9|nr:M15 family metallopeptidase [Nocardioides sp. YIM 152315]MDF1606475.1 M15 family metallopeptidase [Nocardioides sp. YIM 152315]
MSLGWRTVVVCCVLALVTGLGPWSGASAFTATTLQLSTGKALADDPADVAVALHDETGAPVAGASVLLERRAGGVWQPVTTLVTDATGHAGAQLPVARVADDNTLRASYAGDAAHAPAAAEAAMSIERRGAKVSLSGPRTVVDERSIRLRVRWRTETDLPLAGEVAIYRRQGKGPWREYAAVQTDAGGRAVLEVAPRRDSRWQARAPRLDWVRADRSKAHRVDNEPPVRPVRLPTAAPRPRVDLPPQRRAVGDGAHVRIRRIGDGVWRQMTGVTWHSGCPVGRGGLRIVRVNYWGYDGYRHRGEIVAAASAAAAMGAALAEMYDRRLPILSMYRVDRFGWSKRLRGGDDYRSMAAGNTSAFNCRDVVGRSGRRSPHAWGRSLDVNTWENPYRSAHGVVPNGWWQARSHRLVAWRSRSHAVVRLMARHGLRWSFGNGDTQHFDYAGGPQRLLAAQGGPAPCRRFCD